MGLSIFLIQNILGEYKFFFTTVKKKTIHRQHHQCLPRFHRHPRRQGFPLYQEVFHGAPIISVVLGVLVALDDIPATSQIQTTGSHLFSK